MNWKDDTSTYTTTYGHEGKILNSFLAKHADEMAQTEAYINDALNGYDGYQGVRFSMAGYVTDPSFTLDGYHRDAKITVCGTSIDIDNPDWESVANEFIAKWQDLEENDGVRQINDWYDRESRWGWD